MPNQFTQKATHVLNKSLYLAAELGHTYIGSEHMLLALTSETDSVAAKLLETRGILFDRLRAAIVEKVGTGEPTRLTPSDMTPRTKRIIENSAYHALRFGQSYIGTEHILLALLGEKDSVAVNLLASLGVSAKELTSDAARFLGSMQAKGAASPDASRAADAGKAAEPSSLAKYGRDITALAREGKLDPIIGREEETERVIQILSRRTKNNPCLIGEPGVGKTAVVEGLASRIADGSVPQTLTGKQLITLDLSSMLAGAKYRGEFEERMKAVMAEAAANPAVILFIDEIHTIIGAGAAEGAIDAANILKPVLARGEMQVIGATTLSEYRKYIEKDAALARRFQSVPVGEPTPEEAVCILRGLRDKYEAHHRVKITDEAIDAAVQLSVRYIGDRFLPDKAIDLIDEAASKLRIASHTSPPELKEIEQQLASVRAQKEEAIRSQEFEKAASLRDEEKKLTDELETRQSEWRMTSGKEMSAVGAEEIADIVTAWTGIPVCKLEKEESERLTHLSELLRERVIGQEEAADSVARAIRRGRLGLKDPNRPTGSFLFLGPTGVGKTELARVLAELLFGDRNAMIRVDMSEYMEKHSVSKLIGSPPGYVGFEEGGQLTEQLRRKPYSVVLFDEIEKAHPDIFNLLLQILEDGILTDSQGRRVDCKNTILILTSNVGAADILAKKRALGFQALSEPPVKETVMAALRETFKPEFLNRLDEIILFHQLSDTDIERIAQRMLEDIRKRIEKLGVDIRFDDSAVRYLAKEGYDPIWGARPLRRAIQRRVEDSFAAEMLDHDRIHSGDRVTASAENDQIVYTITNSAATLAAPTDTPPSGVD